MTVMVCKSIDYSVAGSQDRNKAMNRWTAQGDSTKHLLLGVIGSWLYAVASHQKM